MGLVRPRLPSRLERHVASYALAAGAAGVGLFTLTPAARADIITGGPVFLYTFEIAHCFSNGHCFKELRNSLRFFGIESAPNGSLNLGPLAAGYRIGPHAGFGSANVLWYRSTVTVPRYSSGCRCSMYKTYRTSGGPWLHNNNGGYLGVRFLINGSTHYGWVALSPGGYFITGEAYESAANDPIRAGQTTETPEPATLGLLALGSLGIGFWRRKKQEPEARSQERRV